MIGIDGARRADVAALANRDPCAAGNPVPLDARILANIFDRAVSGAFQL
jgi:alcohol dehydrogenase class IV